ncbi:hypothetical protein CPB84DRAFT_1758768, partial [Gymnopilus junonius]
MSTSKTDPYLTFKSWLADHGGGFHQDTQFNQDTFGSHVVATKDLGNDSTVVSCPFSLVITQALANKAVLEILGDPPYLKTVAWSERQWISLYIAFHWILGPEESIGRRVLAHFPYLDTLPPSEKLRTPLHFSPPELDLFRGTNLYGATADRERDWENEWAQCLSALKQLNTPWNELFTWDKYLTAATYLSSRAFPSSLLSKTPTLVASPSTEPILIPGVDSLNHARGQPVSWVVTYPSKEFTMPATEPSISLVLHPAILEDQEILNNYGPKPNSELILGYGFSIPNNPDDTILLKVGGIGGNKWEIGRNAQGVDGLWREILSAVQQSDQDSPAYEDVLDASGMMQEMVQTLIDRLPEDYVPDSTIIRVEVSTMFSHYIEGQKAILDSLMEFAKAKEQNAVEMARQEGIDIVLEDE